MNSRFIALESSAAVCGPRIAAVIPCYRVTREILDVLARIGPEVERVYCVDDACPDASGRLIEEGCHDPRVRVLRHDQNRGVGGATLTGFKQALEDGAEIVVKIDGDGQMDPALVPRLVAPIVAGRADYAKGNRFINIETVHAMPAVRLLGNACLSFISKLSSGYWTIFDPTNGFLAVHATVLRELPLHKIHERYFFESDLIFRLNTVGAVIEDVPMSAKYGTETSHLKVTRVLLPFLLLHLRNAAKRILYNHYLRDFSAASVELLTGSAMLLFGLIFGAIRWWGSIQSAIPVTAGTVMLAGLPTLLGVQLLLSFLHYDIHAVPRIPLHLRLRPFVRTPPRQRDEASPSHAGAVSF